MLGYGHHIPEMLSDQREKYWSPERLERYVPHELFNSTVGIVGYGSIAQRLARLLQPFNVTILASKRNLLSESAVDFQIDDQGDPQAQLVRRLYPPQALKSMFKECDFVVVAVPLTPETKGMVGTQQLSALKESAILVDVSRGGVVDHIALADALTKKQFAGAALDVYPEEPLPADSPIWSLPNVIISPHVAGLSPHYTDRAFILFKENLRRYLAGEDLLNKIDLQRGY
jgi:phosphoglycerate dehydrogenase-like enzyme